jgi:predicted protein tyrosine phosphatase
MTPLTSEPLHVLFVCLYNRQRSATAERIFSKDTMLEVRSAGVSADALVRVNARMLDWADVVFVMENALARSIARDFPDNPALQRLVSLDIPDDYLFLDPRLVELLRERTRPHLDRLLAERGDPTRE